MGEVLFVWRVSLNVFGGMMVCNGLFGRYWTGGH